MAKRAIPRFLVPSLGVLALLAAFAVQAIKTEQWNLAPGLGPKKPAILPPEGVPGVPPPRLDADLFEVWQGKPVPEILSQLVSASPEKAAPGDISFPPASPAEAFQPHFGLPQVPEENKTPPLPPFDDVMAIDEGPLFSTNGQPLQVPGASNPITGGRRLLKADFDADGDLDLFIGRGAGLPSSLLRRKENGQWEDVTTAAGLLNFLDLTDAAWIDFDRDGLLDLFTVSRAAKTGGPSLLCLYRNLDGNRFSAIGRDQRFEAPGPVSDFLWDDFDGDSLPDLLLSVAGAKSGIRLLAAIPSENPSNWSFADATAVFGLSGIPGGGPVAQGDFDNDGLSELVITADGQTSLLTREETGKGPFPPFTDVSELLDLTGVAKPGALLFEDFDEDGFLDLALTGGTPEKPEAFAWWNRGGVRFREIPGAAGLAASAPPREMIPLDPDGDGIESVFLTAGATHRGARLEPAKELLADYSRTVIVLNGESGSNANGIGAHLSLLVRDENWTLSKIERHVSGPSTAIGLGPAEKIESITVTWPDMKSSQTRFENLPVNHRIELGPLPSQVKKTPLPDHGVTSFTVAKPESKMGS